MYKNCPKQFWYFYNDKAAREGYNVLGENLAMNRGQEFHLAVDEFYDKIQASQLPWDIHEFRIALPQSKDDVVNGWFDWYAKSEWERFEELSKESLEPDKAFMPLHTELKVELPDRINRTGHVDRIDLIPGTKNELCIVEYKCGKSYDMEKSYMLTKMNAEIGFYAAILNKDKRFNQYRITHWKCINPFYEKIWYNNISGVTLKAVEKAYNGLVDLVNDKGPFDRKTSVLCMHCPYFEPCLGSEEARKEFGFI